VSDGASPDVSGGAGAGGADGAGGSAGVTEGSGAVAGSGAAASVVAGSSDPPPNKRFNQLVMPRCYKAGRTRACSLCV
jgi:hypothetical protein